MNGFICKGYKIFIETGRCVTFMGNLMLNIEGTSSNLIIKGNDPGLVTYFALQALGMHAFISIN